MHYVNPENSSHCIVIGENQVPSSSFIRTSSSRRPYAVAEYREEDLINNFIKEFCDAICKYEWHSSIHNEIK